MVVCPKCHSALARLSEPICPACGWCGSCNDGILCLLADSAGHDEDFVAYREHYDALAESDLRNPLLAVDYVGYQAENLVRYMGDVSGLSVCDVGCGRGSLSLRLARHGACVTAVDMSPAYLRHVQGSGEDIRLICCDADNLPFEREFDLLVSTDVMEHTLRPGGFLYSVNHALKPDGRAYIRVPYRENLIAYASQLGCPYRFVHLRSYNKPLLRDIFAGAGFVLERFYLDGFSLGTPRPLFVERSRVLAKLYSILCQRLRPRLHSEAQVTAWPSPVARILMRPTEIVVRARKRKSVEPLPGGAVYRLAPDTVGTPSGQPG